MLKKVAILCFFLYSILIPGSLFGGHEVFIQLVFQETNSSGLDRRQVPASVGVPIPKEAMLTDLNDIVLVGNELSQFRTLSLYPNGTVRWLLIDTLVDLRSGPRNIAFHLTMGHSPENKWTMAEERESTIQIHTGVAGFTIPKAGPALLESITFPNSVTPSPLEAPLHLNFLNSESMELLHQSVVIEENGPVKAVIAIEQIFFSSEGSLKLKTRLFFHQGSAHIQLETSVRSLKTTEPSIEIPDIELVMSGQPYKITEGESDPNDSSRNLEIRYLDNKFLLGFRGRSTWNSGDYRVSKNQLNVRIMRAATLITQPSVKAQFRSALHIDFLPSDTDAPLHFPAPALAGRATSVDVYNDTEALQEKILPILAEGKTTLHPSSPEIFSSITQSLYGYLRNTDNSIGSHYAKAAASIDRVFEEGLKEHTRTGEAISLWYFCSGDESVRETYLEWGEEYLQRVEAAPELFHQSKSVLQLVDLFKLTGDPATKELAWKVVSEWLPFKHTATLESWASIETVGHSELVMISELLKHCGFDEAREDPLLDLLEGLVQFKRDEPPNSRFSMEGYIATGDDAFLIEGQDWLNAHREEVSQSMQHLIQSPLHHSVWRPLPIDSQLQDDGSTQFSWTVPRRAHRIRIKYSQKPIQNSARKETAQTLPFFAAQNIKGEPIPNQNGTKQYFSIPPMDGTEHLYFAAKFHERAPALPNPTETVNASSFTEQDPESSNLNFRLGLLVFSGIVLVIAFMMKIQKTNS